MSLLMFGVSHRSAPVPVLERMAVSDADRPKFAGRLLESAAIGEAMIVSTCNRVEVYAVVEAFHPALEAIGATFSDHSRLSVAQLTPHAYVHYSEAAVEHLFSVAAGLDSMVVGEQQIIGQIRDAYASADEHGTAGRVLHEVAQQALRVGKRVHTETGIDTAGASVVSVALEKAATVLGRRPRRAVVVGAGAMGGLAVAHLVRGGVGELTVVNRSRAAAENLAANAGRSGDVVTATAGFDGLAGVMATADVVVTATGATGTVIGLADVHRALAARTPAVGTDDPLVFCDLGMPRDVDPAVAELPGAVIVDIESLAGDTGTSAAEADAALARRIVSGEVAGYLTAQREAEVTPTVAALRQWAAEVVDAEVLRLDTRLRGLDDGQREEVARAVRRVVDKLLHAPTVRVKQLAGTERGPDYAAALRELFELSPGTAESVSTPSAATADRK